MEFDPSFVLGPIGDVRFFFKKWLRGFGSSRLYGRRHLKEEKVHETN